MECKLLYCQEPAAERRIVPYGEVNLCGWHALTVEAALAATRHAYEFGVPSPESQRALLRELHDACRHGPHQDPPLEDAERGPEYRQPDGLGVR